MYRIENFSLSFFFVFNKTQLTVMGNPDDRSPSQSEVRHKNTMGFMGIFKVILNKEHQGAYLEQCSCFWHKALLFTSEYCFLLWIWGKQFWKQFSSFCSICLGSIVILQEISLKHLDSTLIALASKALLFHWFQNGFVCFPSAKQLDNHVLFPAVTPWEISSDLQEQSRPWR